MVFVTPAAAIDHLVQGEQAVVSGTNDNGLNVRSAPSIDSDVHFIADEGTAMEIISGPEAADGVTWYGVSVNGIEGWVIADFVAGPSSQAGDQVMVVNTDGHGLRLRSGASGSADTVTVLPEGYVATVVGLEHTDETGISWAEIDFNGTAGFAHRDYLAVVSASSQEVVASEPVQAEQVDEAPPEDQEIEEVPPEEPEEVLPSDPEPEPEPELEPEPASSENSTVAVGGNAEIINTSGYGLNIRSGAGYGHSVVTVAEEGDVVQVLSGPEIHADGSSWWTVDYRGLSGWAHGDYLQATEAEPTGAGTSTGASNPNEDTGNSTPPASSSTMGEQIAAEAMRYLGYPYVWGGTSPSGFDCSGYIYYVVNQVTGGGFPRMMEAQVNRGTHVPADQLQPGDIVFQQNTYQWGLSHAGIYIGNGQFIHAATPGTGVVISNLWDAYWGPRYYTARRIS
jgi:cell wall-associated NlpC family hydrolase